MQGSGCLLVCMSTEDDLFFSSVRPRLRRNTRTSLCNHSKEGRAVVMHHRLAPKRKYELRWCTCCLLYLRCGSQMRSTTCQCPVARLVTLEVNWSLWRDPNSSVTDMSRSDRLKENWQLWFTQTLNTIMVTHES